MTTSHAAVMEAPGTHGRGVDLVLDCSGVLATFTEAQSGEALQVAVDPRLPMTGSTS